MKTSHKIALYLLIGFYLLMGLAHFINPNQYLIMMPAWLPFPTVLIYFSGLGEIGLALLLIKENTRAIAAKSIIAMLVVFFFAIHVPQSIAYNKTNHPDFTMSLIRLPIQFLFIAWAWMFVENKKTMGT